MPTTKDSDYSLLVPRSLHDTVHVFFPLTLFYAMVRWSDVTPGFASKALFFFSTTALINDWFSFRESKEIYKLPMLAIDLLIIFSFVNLFSALTRTQEPLGYDHAFWLHFAMLGLLYMLWDLLIAGNESTSGERRRGLLFWVAKTSSYTLMALFVYLSSAGIGHDGVPWLSTQILKSASILTAVVFLITLYNWNREKVAWLRSQLTATVRG